MRQALEGGDLTGGSFKSQALSLGAAQGRPSSSWRESGFLLEQTAEGGVPTWPEMLAVRA